MLNKYPNLKGTIFIVTYGRSGSTILQSLLQTIPDAHIKGENGNVLVELYRASLAANHARKTWGKKNQPLSHPWYGANEINPVRFEKRLVRMFTEEILNVPSDARWFGFKEIRYPNLGNELPEFLNFCRRIFPNAHFVFNSRNGKDVAKSKWWARKPKQKVLSIVKTMDEVFAKYSQENPTFSHHVFFEETVADPNSLKPLFLKLGEPFDINKAQTILNTRLTH